MGLVAPKAKMEWVREHLAAPKNLRLLVLPPYSPKLDPHEQVFQYLKAIRFATRAFATVAPLQAACESA